MLIEDTTVLNRGQQAASDGFFKFLFSEEKELIITGGGGVGKTYLMGHLIDVIMPRYFQSCKLMGIAPEFDTVDMTATTNKAAEVLALATKRTTDTLASYLGLKVTEDHDTGQGKLTKTQNWKVHQRKIIFVDEAFTADSHILALLDEATHQCKIIYVGDRFQLNPVTEAVSPLCKKTIPIFELTEPMRNSSQPALMAVCEQLRETVETGIFRPIQCVPGVIDWLDAAEMEITINQLFKNQTRANRILAFENTRVTEYNDHVRQLRGLGLEYEVGELLIAKDSIRLGKHRVSVEEEVEILEQERQTHDLVVETILNENVFLTVRNATIRTRLGHVHTNVPLPVDREHFAGLLKYYSRTKNWNRYFFLKNKIPILRPRDATTIHKAQGSTYDTVIADMASMNRCHQPNVAARLLYVAFSRARNRIILYGDLAEKYGGLRA